MKGVDHQPLATGFRKLVVCWLWLSLIPALPPKMVTPVLGSRGKLRDKPCCLLIRGAPCASSWLNGAFVQAKCMHSLDASISFLYWCGSVSKVNYVIRSSLIIPTSLEKQVDAPTPAAAQAL